MRRSALGSFVTSLRRCVVAMEACCGAHHLGRVFAAQGHEVRLMSPEYVRPYVKAQKNDDLDAEAIAEAASRPTMRFVEVKSQAPSDIQALHRARERLVSERTALINHLRALLVERGIVAPQGRRKLEEQLSTFADEDGIEALSPRIRLLIEDLRAEWRALDERIAVFDKEFVQARNEEPVRRLVTIPGIGTINATALVAAVGNARAFRRGRDMAAWLGLTPRQMTTGGKPRLLHQQARQSLSSQELDPWRARRAALPG
jgi:transposase